LPSRGVCASAPRAHACCRQRKLTGKALVRFTEEDLQALPEEAERQGTSLPALMRELSLRTLVSQAS